MRTTLDLSDELIKELMRITRSKTKTDAIEQAIKDFIRRKKIEDLKSLSGKIEITSNWRSLRELELDES